MTKIAMINPPVPNSKNWVREGRCQQLDIWGAPFAPLSLALVSRRLVDAGFETIIIDAGPEGKSLIEVINQCRRFSTNLAVLTLSTPTIETDLNWFAVELKKAIPQILIAGIGVHSSSLPKETLEQYRALDFAVMGEPEETVRELTQNLGRDLSLIHGLAYRDVEGRIRVNQKREMIKEIDSLGLPDWGKINFSNYPMPIIGKPFSLIHFARGCPFKCDYCTAHTYAGRSFRKRSLPHLMKEIEFNMSLGVHNFLFWTETMTYDSNYLNQFLDQLISTGLSQKIKWVCNSRVDTVNFEMLKKMKQAGCWQIAFGFEFGTDEFLKIANKGGRASVEIGRKAALMASEAGLVVDGHFMLGYPGEKETHLQQTIDFALGAPLTFAHFYSVVPYPGAKIYNDWLNQPQTNQKTDWEKFDQREPLINSTALSRNKIVEIQTDAYRKFYLRPKTAMRILKIPSRLSEFSNVFKSSVAAFKSLILKSE